jgi:hypothetical protein
VEIQSIGIWNTSVVGTVNDQDWAAHVLDDWTSVTLQPTMLACGDKRLGIGLMRPLPAVVLRLGRVGLDEDASEELAHVVIIVTEHGSSLLHPGLIETKVPTGIAAGDDEPRDSLWIARRQVKTGL